MNKQEIKSKMQSIEESIKEQTNELNKLRLEMDKPEKPTLEEMCEGKIMFFLDNEGDILDNCLSGYEPDSYLSRERAEKELLRIKLSVIADYLNGGLFEPEDEQGYYIYFSGYSNDIKVSSGIRDRYGFILFRTRELAEQAMTYFTNEELIKLLK